jgi:uncharacterized membrane protein YbhN (UPF0104 family)
MKKKYLKWVLTLFLFTFLCFFFFKKINFSEVYSLLKNIELKVVFISLLFGFILYFLSGLMLKISIKKLASKEIKLYDAIFLPMTSSIFGIIIPKGGLFYQSIILKKKYSVSYSNNISVFFLYYLLVVFISLLLLLFFILLSDANKSYKLMILLLIVFVIFLFFLGIKRTKLKKRKYYIINLINSILNQLKYMFDDTFFLIKILLFSFARILVRVAWYFFIVSSVNVDSGFLMSIILTIAYELHSAFILIPGNFLVNEFVTSIILNYSGAEMFLGFFIESILTITGWGIVFSFGIVGLLINWQYLNIKNEKA